MRSVLAPQLAEPVLISLGSNLGDRREILTGALRAIAALDRVEIVAASSLWETEAWGGPPGQEPFLNAALLLRVSRWTPAALLDELQRVEELTGRVRTVRNGPRTLDLDILLFGDRVLSTTRLDVPHRRMHTRSFVLQPAAEVAGEMMHPRLRLTIGELARVVGRDGIIGIFEQSGWQHAVSHPQGL